MNSELNNICKNFIQNRDTIQKNGKWGNKYTRQIAAGIFTKAGIMASKENLSKAKELIKNNTGVFSKFRGEIMLTATSILATSANPEEIFKKAIEAHDIFKKDFKYSSLIIVAAISIANLAGEQDIHKLSQKAKDIYRKMRRLHPFLISPDDSVYSILLALSDKTGEELISESERCYKLLKNHFSSRNSVQSLSNALALFDGPAESKVRKVLDIYNSLKSNGRKYGTTFELSSLASIAMLPSPASTIVKDIIDVDKFLSTQKGYGFWGGLSKKHRLMHSAMLVSFYHQKCDDDIMMATITTSTLSLIIADQTAMIAATSASTVVVSS